MFWRVILGLLGASLVCGIAVVLCLVFSQIILIGRQPVLMDIINEAPGLFLLTQMVITPCVWLGGIPCFLVLRRIQQNLLRHYARAGFIMVIPLTLGSIVLLAPLLIMPLIVFTFLCTLIAPPIFWWIVRPDRWELRRGNGERRNMRSAE